MLIIPKDMTHFSLTFACTKIVPISTSGASKKKSSLEKSVSKTGTQRQTVVLAFTIEYPNGFVTQIVMCTIELLFLSCVTWTSIVVEFFWSTSHGRKKQSNCTCTKKFFKENDVK